jgi:menaquinone-dependent protoporphyrinogen IX oxidase
MDRVLIGYTTNAGSTKEIAGKVASELIQPGVTVDVKELSKINDLDLYDTVIIGAPMILGWHKEALTFIRKYQSDLEMKKVAYFACAMKLTKNPAADTYGISLALDPTLASDPQHPGRIGLEEGFTTVDHYLNSMITAAPEIKPVSVAFFNGKLDYSKLSVWQKLFVRIFVRAEPGDFRNWDFIKTWSTELNKTFTMIN